MSNIDPSRLLSTIAELKDEVEKLRIRVSHYKLNISEREEVISSLRQDIRGLSNELSVLESG